MAPSDQVNNMLFGGQGVMLRRCTLNNPTLRRAAEWRSLLLSQNLGLSEGQLDPIHPPPKNLFSLLSHAHLALTLIHQSPKTKTYSLNQKPLHLHHFQPGEYAQEKGTDIRIRASLRTKGCAIGPWDAWQAC